MWVPFDKFTEYGTFVFLAPLPTLFVVFYAAALLDKFDDRDSRRDFVGVLVIHYVLTIVAAALAFTSNIGRELMQKMLFQFPFSFLFTAGWYFAGQALLWLGFYQALKNRVR